MWRVFSILGTGHSDLAGFRDFVSGGFPEDFDGCLTRDSGQRRTTQGCSFAVSVFGHPASRGRATTTSRAQDKPTGHTSINYHPELFGRGHQ